MAVASTQHGLTLVELLVTLAVSILMLSGVFAMLRSHSLTAARQEESTAMEQRLITTLVQMADDLRMCGFAPAGGTFGFDSLTDKGRLTNSTAIYFTWDEDTDGVLDPNGTETVGYRINVNADGTAGSGSVLSKFQAGSWQAMSAGIGAVDFVYQTANGILIADPALALGSIRTVQITLTAVPSTLHAGLGIANRTMSTTVLCRNLND